MVFDQLSTLPVMCTIAIGMAIAWGTLLEAAKKKIYDSLPNTDWWQNAIEPQKSMMANFGFPKEPTAKFPDGITESMARDSFAFTVTICLQHGASALFMLPVLIYGWEESSDTVRSLFILGTLCDLGFDLYDSYSSSIKTFTPNHPNALPIEFWIVIVALHHTTALSLVLPMNLSYAHRYEYHQTAFSLLMAAALCYGSGCYKFALDIGKKRDFLLYKLIVLFQLGIILYTRVFLWFPAASSFRAHVREEHDMTFFYGASVMIGIFSLFNLILVTDAVKAAIKTIPKTFPKTPAEQERRIKAFRRASSALDYPGLAAMNAVTKIVAKRKFKAAVHAVMASKRLESSMSEASSHTGKKVD